MTGVLVVVFDVLLFPLFISLVSLSSFHISHIIFSSISSFTLNLSIRVSILSGLFTSIEVLTGFFSLVRT